ncbi:MAG: hypothetical protein AB7P03_30770 [Kofleriaceae bacterium]
MRLAGWSGIALCAYDDQLPDGVQVAAVAWGKIYTASCVDRSLATFASENYARHRKASAAMVYRCRGR